MFYVLLLLSDFVGKFLQSCVTNKDEFSLGELMQLLCSRIERMMPFVSFYFLLFLLPCLINAFVSVWVCECVYNFHCFLPQQSDGLWCASSLKLIARNNTDKNNCLIVCESTRSGTSIGVYVWRATLDRFFRSFCVYVW